MVSVSEVADAYITRMAAIDPIEATAWGVPGHDDRLPDLSPAGIDERVELQRTTLAAVTAAPKATDADRVAADVMAERLTSSLALHEAGDDFRSMRVLHSPQESVRRAFDLMPLESETDWQVMAARLQAVQSALEGLRATLAEGLDAAGGVVTATGGSVCHPVRHVGRPPRRALVLLRPPGPALPWRPQRRRARAGCSGRRRGPTSSSVAGCATITCREPRRSIPSDATGTPSRPVISPDPSSTSRTPTVRVVRTASHRGADVIGLRADCAGKVAGGGHRPAGGRSGPGDRRRRRLPAWNQQLIDATIGSLDGVHFDIAEPIRHCEAMIAPPGGAAAMYYTAPSEDFSRPGRTWYPTLGKTRFPLWREVSICYHEGVPGHHLQIAQVLFRRPPEPVSTAGRLHLRPWRGVGAVCRAPHGRAGLSRRSRIRAGHAGAQAMRAVRVIVDIGMHLELPIPSDERLPPRRALDGRAGAAIHDRTITFSCRLHGVGNRPIPRLPGQAISYKVGERVWLEGRQAGQGPKRGRLRPQGLPPLRPRSRRHGSGPARAGAAAVLRRPPGYPMAPYPNRCTETCGQPRRRRSPDPGGGS